MHRFIAGLTLLGLFWAVPGGVALAQGEAAGETPPESPPATVETASPRAPQSPPPPRSPQPPQPPRPAGPQPPAATGPGAVEVPPVDLPEAAQDPEAHHRLAIEARDRDDGAQALDHFERALVARPDQLRWGSEYRQVAIAEEAYDRSIGFWRALVEAHPGAASARLNLGYAYVDKIPAEGAITQVILANTALGHFTRALELEETWLGFFTRGNSYMYWPAIFGRTDLGIADLKKAIDLAEARAAAGEPRRQYQCRAWAGLGDGYWRLDDRTKMREVWREGLELYPGCADLVARLDLDDEALDAYLDALYDANVRVGTHLNELWTWLDAQEAAPDGDAP